MIQLGLLDMSVIGKSASNLAEGEAEQGTSRARVKALQEVGYTLTPTDTVLRQSVVIASVEPQLGPMPAIRSGLGLDRGDPAATRLRAELGRWTREVGDLRSSPNPAAWGGSAPFAVADLCAMGRGLIAQRLRATPLHSVASLLRSLPPRQIDNSTAGAGLLPGWPTRRPTAPSACQQRRVRVDD